jgi:hypothetical protein
MEQIKNIVTNDSNKIEYWFDELISTLSTHQLMLSTNTASESLNNFYSTLLSGNANEIANLSRSQTQRHFISSIILDYVEIIKNNTPLKLAFNFNDSEVLVWAEINENDELKEKHLYLAEAKINAKYNQYGFDMTTMIVEDTDNISIPNHYKPFVK